MGSGPLNTWGGDFCWQQLKSIMQLMLSTSGVKVLGRESELSEIYIARDAIYCNPMVAAILKLDERLKRYG